ncbi:MAG: hypothetical protein UH824_05230 [Acutalibacteraceae bacterium]|nr:hypothetical protein [Acutalibacteraceae bacterium]
MVILGELFESDLVLFLLIGFAAAAIIGLLVMRKKSLLIGTIISAAVYAVCEIMLSTYVVKAFLSQLLTLFFGTAAVGTTFGFLVGFVIKLIREKAKKQ